jgi:hypothetical protein
MMDCAGTKWDVEGINVLVRVEPFAPKGTTEEDPGPTAFAVRAAPLRASPYRILLITSSLPRDDEACPRSHMDQ